MFKKLMTGLASLALVVAVGMTAMVQTADAAPTCYRTGAGTYQCIGK